MSIREKHLPIRSWTWVSREILAVDVLHGEKVLPVHLADVVNATDIRVRNLAGITYLSMKSFESRRVVLERGGKKLEGYNIPELEIFSAVDLAHAAAPQQSNDPVSFDENSARRESPTSWRVRTDGNPHRRDSISIRLQCGGVENGNGAPA